MILCHICWEPFELAGRDGLLWHTLHEHPTSELAAHIKVELAALDFEVSA